MGFRDLDRFETLKARYEKYEAWRKLSPKERQQKFAAITDETRRAKPRRIEGFISLFNTVGNNRIFVPAQILDPDFTTGQGADVAGVLRSILATYTVTPTELAALATPIVVRAKGIKPARLALTKIDGYAKKDSRITGAEYNKPDVDTISSPFGQATGGQDFDVAVAAIREMNDYTKFIEGQNNRKNKAKFTPEGI